MAVLLQTCSCPDCQRLDFDLPGEGRQLAFATTNDTPAGASRRRAARLASARRGLHQAETLDA